MKKKVLVFGATGMAGHIVYLYLQQTGQYNLQSVVYRSKLTEDCIVLDVTNKEEVKDLIDREQPHYIVNCIGILIKGSNEHSDNAIYINSYFPHLLARLADSIGAKLIHVSTDCVFSGAAGQYRESAFKDANDVYGRSKALGEVTSNVHSTLRTSIIGPELKTNGEGLFNWFMHQNGDINGYLNAYWGGITTIQLAKAIHSSIINDLRGLLHVTNGEKISKYALLKLFKQIWLIDGVKILEANGKAVDKSLVKSEFFDFAVPTYREMLLELKQWMDEHNELYVENYSTQ